MSYKMFPPDGVDIEPEAVNQLKLLAANPNTLSVMGMPDLHVGKGGPVGMALLGHNPVPSIIGGDLGCGFSLFRIDLKAKKLANIKWLADRMDGLDEPWTGELPDIGFATPFDHSQGSIGLGNHFVEIQIVNETSSSIVREEEVLMLIHTGSRGFGDSVFRNITSVCRDQPLEDYSDWMIQHDRCILWAKTNRLLMAQRVSEVLGADHETILDVPHNFVEKVTDGFLHRKGCSPSDQGLVVIPGSRGTPTFLIEPSGHQDSLNSLPHGAGRKMSRSAAREGTQNRAMLEESSPLSNKRRGGFVICGDDDLLLEERPRAYKDVTKVVAGVEKAELGKKIAEFHPVITFKSSVQDKKHRDRTRTPEARKKDIEKRNRR